MNTTRHKSLKILLGGAIIVQFAFLILCSVGYYLIGKHLLIQITTANNIVSLSPIVKTVVTEYSSVLKFLIITSSTNVLILLVFMWKLAVIDSTSPSLPNHTKTDSGEKPKDAPPTESTNITETTKTESTNITETTKTESPDADNNSGIPPIVSGTKSPLTNQTLAS